jgi:nucleotide-binding universal stress UspA family protein
MYKRILLAYDGSIEGRTALREGALLARVNVARRSFSYLSSSIPAHFCWQRRPTLERLFRQTMLLWMF